MKWMHFLHNHVNTMTNKTKLTYDDSLALYFEKYKSNDYIFKKKHDVIKNVVFCIFIFLLIIVILMLYKI